MPNSIQSRDYSKDSVPEDISRNQGGDPNLLSTNRDNDGRSLNANYDRPDDRWNRENGFVFLVPQV